MGGPHLFRHCNLIRFCKLHTVIMQSRHMRSRGTPFTVAIVLPLEYHFTTNVASHVCSIRSSCFLCRVKVSAAYLCSRQPSPPTLVNVHSTEQIDSQDTVNAKSEGNRQVVNIRSIGPRTEFAIG